MFNGYVRIIMTLLFNNFSPQSTRLKHIRFVYRSQMFFALTCILKSCINNALHLIATIIECIDYRSEEHTSELQSRFDLVCRLLLEKKKSRAVSGMRMSASTALPV